VRYERRAAGGDAEHGLGYVKLCYINFRRLGCISRQNWLNQTNKNQPGRFVEENYKPFVYLELQQSPTMLVRRIKAWIKLQNGKTPVLPSCIDRVHAEFFRAYKIWALEVAKC